MVQTTKSPHALVVNIFALTSLAFNLETSRDLIVHSNWSVPVVRKKLKKFWAKMKVHKLPVHVVGKQMNREFTTP